MIKTRITKVKEKRSVKAVMMLVLVLSVVAHRRGSCTTCIRGKKRAKNKKMVREFNGQIKTQKSQSTEIDEGGIIKHAPSINKWMQSLTLAK